MKAKKLVLLLTTIGVIVIAGPALAAAQMGYGYGTGYGYGAGYGAGYGYGSYGGYGAYPGAAGGVGGVGYGYSPGIGVRGSEYGAYYQPGFEQGAIIEERELGDDSIYAPQGGGEGFLNEGLEGF